MFTNVIAGVDGFGGGRDAVTLAQALGAGRLTLVGVHPHDAPRTRGTVGGYERIVHEDTIRMLEAARMQAGVEAEVLAVGDNSPARGLQHAAEQRGADLLVVGAAHHGPLGRVVLGDVSRSVLHHAPCPVAIAPKHTAPVPPRSIAVGYDGGPESQAALALARDWAQEHRAALSVWVVWELPSLMLPVAAGTATDLDTMTADARRWADDRLAGVLADLPSTTAGHVVRGRAGAELAKASESVDLLVVGSRGWGPFSRVALGSTSDWLMHHASCPVVVTPRPATAHDEGAAPLAGAAQAG